MSSNPEESPGAVPRKRTSWVAWLALVVLVALIAAVAIPARVDYTHRSQASEAISLLKGISDPLAAHFAVHGKWPESLGKLAAAREGRYTRDVVISGGAGGSGEIELTATLRTEGVDSRVAGKSIRLRSQDGGKTWECRPGTAAAHHLPLPCRPPQ